MPAPRGRMHRHCFLVALGALCALPLCVAASAADPSKDTADATRCSVFYQQAPRDCPPFVEAFVDVQGRIRADAPNSSSVLGDAYGALAVLQNTYLDPLRGTWPTSIDWTGAVVETILSGTLITLSRSLELVDRGHDRSQKEQLISSIFAQVTHSFFGQNAVAILDEAYDDVLWVVLGWLEAIKFVRLHSTLHHPKRGQHCLSVPATLDSALRTMSWHGNHWVCAFADRARAFWDFATKGWDTTLCLGGMVWNPRLEPYKNAITNELWIAASMSMYEHFPDDKFNQSWAASKNLSTNDPVYLAAAVVGYKWLREVNMTNSQGLYVDGFHVDKSKPGNINCDQRDEMVYTYNQGVILTGQRGLFTATGSPYYLAEGHTLIQAVINATGWDLGKNRPIDDNVRETPPQGALPPWRGLGRYGILEEKCDAEATCSQDSQTFKGIFFHHLTAFCAPIDQAELKPHSRVVDRDRVARVRAAHDDACVAYLGWTRHNMLAALETRDPAGRFGMWWGAGLFRRLPSPTTETGTSTSTGSMGLNSTDYRNKGTPRDRTWGLHETWQPGARGAPAACQAGQRRPDASLRLGGSAFQGGEEPDGRVRVVVGAGGGNASDANDRGRGRTVETQAGGLALLRAYWELSRR
ncbi:hypothetical protein E4U41_006956 [Claviceps citrina]|nr:hypothetical protein E4U41_006956 [Claviceps citrina]